jgi:hypothetical protein
VERSKGNPLLAGLIVLVTLWATILPIGGGTLAMCGHDNDCAIGGQPAWWNYLAGAAAFLGGSLVFLGGLWCAWRLGSGRWRLRRPSPLGSSGSASAPSAAERL